MRKLILFLLFCSYLPLYAANLLVHNASGTDLSIHLTGTYTRLPEGSWGINNLDWTYTVLAGNTNSAVGVSDGFGYSFTVSWTGDTSGSFTGIITNAENLIITIGEAAPIKPSQIAIGSTLVIGQKIPYNGFVDPPCDNIAATITSGSTRADINGYVGFIFTVGASDINVCAVKRLIMGSTATTTHAVYIVSTTGVMLTSSVDLNGVAVGDYASTSVSPVTLTSGSTYAILVAEDADLWYDLTPVTLTSAFSSVTACFTYAEPTTVGSLSLGTADHTYGGVNFNY